MSSSTSHRDFLALFLQHYGVLYGYIVRQGVPPADADDVVQESATVLWQKFDQFRPGTSFRSWACSVARFEILKRHERLTRESRVLRLDAATEAELAQLEEALPADDRRRDLLRGCVERLGANARRLVGWFYEEGLSVADMARRMRSSPEAVRVRLCRVRQWLGRCVAAAAREDAHA